MRAATEAGSAVVTITAVIDGGGAKTLCPIEGHQVQKLQRLASGSSAEVQHGVVRARHKRERRKHRGGLLQHQLATALCTLQQACHALLDVCLRGGATTAGSAASIRWHSERVGAWRPTEFDELVAEDAAQIVDRTTVRRHRTDTAHAECERAAECCFDP
eukprot:5586990-Prymnesium_polylepis.1